MLHVKLAHEIRHIANPCPPKRINTLVVVADRHHGRSGITQAHRITAGQHLDPRVLQLIGVLKLVDQNVPKTLLIVGTNGNVVTQKLITTQHQLTKINHALALALRLVGLVNIDLAACVRVLRFNVFGAQAVLFATGNKPLQLLGREALVVHAQLLAQTLDCGELVLGV